jgi:hypothetical protein
MNMRRGYLVGFYNGFGVSYIATDYMLDNVQTGALDFIDKI